ncbi:MAG TPA: class I SAM-dependent methyltransferase [Acidobacteriaceae bacterium]
MDEARPSQTALSVALRRAAHQLYDEPVVFADPVAVAILGGEYAAALGRTPRRVDRPYSLGLRAYLVARSRFAEEGLGRAVAAGVRQYVLLGAGLDTFAYRNPYQGLRVFEVDHPATQAWKRGLLERNGIAEPEWVRYVPVDFERQSLAAELAAGGFDAGQPAFLSCLGVVPYLTLGAFRATVGFVAGLAPGTGLALDYGQPRAVLPPLEQLAHDSLASRVEARGEPLQLFFTPGEMAGELGAFAGH